MTSSNNQEHKHDQLEGETVEDTSTPGNVVSLVPSTSEDQSADDRLSLPSVEHVLGDAQNVGNIPSNGSLLLEQNSWEQEIKPLSPSPSTMPVKDRSNYPPIPIQSGEQAQKGLQPSSPSKDAPKALGSTVIPKRPQGSLADSDPDKTVLQVQSSDEEKSADNRAFVQLQDTREEKKGAAVQVTPPPPAAPPKEPVRKQEVSEGKTGVTVQVAPPPAAPPKESVRKQEVSEGKTGVPTQVVPPQAPIRKQEISEEKKGVSVQVAPPKAPIRKQEISEGKTGVLAQAVSPKESVRVRKQETGEEKKETPTQVVPPQGTGGRKGAPVQETSPKTGVALQEQEAREALIEDLLALDQSVTGIAEDDDQSPTPHKEVPSASLIENVVLYRGQHFYVRTTVRPEKRRYSHPLRKPTGHTAMMPKIVPDQKDRVAASETRLMPAIDLKDLIPRKRRLPLPPWLEIAWVALGVIISVIIHAYNMFNYPRYEMDEGTYMSSAWAILNGKLYPYAYGYGHPPFAWMQLAGLVQLAGGFFLFGNAINTGRVLMLFYTAGSTLLVYLIARKLSGSRSMALLALVLSALSPLAVTYQRLVLLDNIASFWFLLSLYLLVISRSQLRYTILSAICFGLSMLSKEVLILFMPAMLYGVWLYTTSFQRKFAFVAFIYTFAAIGSLYILLAVLKGELFPEGFLPWDKHQHLSLLGTLLDQTARGQSQGPLSLGWQAWYGADPLFMTVGLAAIAFNVAIGWWRRNHLFLAILAISYWILLIRGGVVFPFYFIPLIPMMAMNSAIMIHALTDWMGRYVRLDLFRAFLIFGIIAIVLVFDATTSGSVYNGNLTKVQTQAIAWVGANIPRDSYIIMNSYMYMDVRAEGGAAVGNGSVFPNAEVYINIATDPVLLAQINKNWDRVDYIVADSQIEDYITSKSTHLPTGAEFMLQALKAAGYPHSPCATFKAPGYEMHVWCVKHRDLKPVASTLPVNQPPVAVSAGMPVEMRTRLG